jgi:hypothetical protein
MPKNALSQDERLLIKLVEKLYLPEEDKNSLLQRLRDGEMSEDLATEIRQKLTDHHPENENDEVHAATRTRHLTELAMLVKRWRLSNQSRHFGRK